MLVYRNVPMPFLLLPLLNPTLVPSTAEELFF